MRRKYTDWCNLSDEEARREFGRLELLDLLAEIALTLGGVVIVAAIIAAGICLWD